MMLLNPKQHRRAYRDERSRELMLRTIDFFERKGKRRLKADDHARVWYADFLEFVKQEGIFHDYAPVFAGYDLPNVALFVEQIAAFRELMTAATPDEAQRRDLDFLMALGEIFVLIVYAELVLENARLYAVDDGLVDQIFDCLVRDVSHFALELYGKPATTAAQMEHCLRMIRKPVVDQARYERVWHDHVYALKGAYRMND